MRLLESDVLRAVLIETSCTFTEVALASDQGIMARRWLSSARKHARDLAPSIKDLLDQQGWKARTLDLIAVDIGPGSYTGLRVGLMSAKTLAYATNAKLVGIDTMTVLTNNAPPEVALVAAIVDAQQGLVYSSLMSGREGQADGVEIEVLSAEEWAKRLAPDAYVTGPALLRFESLLPLDQPRARGEEALPKVDGLWKAAITRYRRGSFDDPFSLTPLYLRPSSAEQKWDRRVKKLP